MPEPSRQLAAIMFTDIVGYTALMGKDSAKALELIRISKEIQKPLVEQHNGKWLKEMGDGAMVQFGSALDAVNCSMEIQKAARGELDAKLRIGIHLGDVQVEENDVHGDGVNVAARLESIADPGGIYISESIEKAIRGQTDVQAKYLGEVKLKNVAYGVRTYAVQGVGLPIPQVGQEKQLSGHLWAEMQRRGVVRAGVSYLVVALLLFLLMREAQNWLTLPDLSLTILVTALAVGFPMAMYLAWNYERSPEGFVRTSSRESWQNPYSARQRKPLTSSFIITGLILIIALLLFFPDKVPIGETGNEPNTIKDRSIAAIPFKNLSEEKGSQYFSDGMMDAILSNLSKIGDLKVISRTSTEQYRDNPKASPEIAEELGVAYILEGSVQRYRNKVRIIVQLIKAREDEHIWSETYDRELTDLFEVQSEIAKQIAGELRAELSPQDLERLEVVPTSNLAAYDMYLKGRQYYNNFLYGRDEKDLRLAIDFYKKALELDPNFFLAKIHLGWTFIDRVDRLGEEVNLYDSAHLLANDLIDQYPDRSEILTLLGSLYRHKGINKVKAKEVLIKAVTLNPNDPKALFELATYFTYEEGRSDLAQILDQRASSVEPSNALYYQRLGFSLHGMGDYEKAEKAYLKGLSIQPDFVAAYISLGNLYAWWKGDYKKQLALLEQGLSYNPENINLLHQIAQAYSWYGEFEKSEKYFLKVKNVVESEGFNKTRKTPWFPHRYAYTLWNLGKKEEAKKYFQESIERDLQFIEENILTWYNSYYDLAGVNAFLGNKDEAHYWLNKMTEKNFWMPPFFFLRDPLFDNLKGEDRFKEYLEATYRRIDGQKRNYEELKDLPFSQVIERLSEPLEITLPEKL